MGRGNPIIRDRLGREFPTFYIEDPYIENENEYSYDDFITDFKDYTQSLVTHFSNASTAGAKYTYYSDFMSVFLATDVFEFVVSDGCNKLAVGCIPIYKEEDYDDDYKYDTKLFKKEADKFMILLGEQFEITKRINSWVSSKVINNNYYE